MGGQCVLGAGGPRARELEEALTTLAGDLNAATCHLVALLGELDARGAGSRRGIWACPRCAITRLATPGRETDLVEMALTDHLAPDDGVVVAESLEATSGRVRADQGAFQAPEELADPDLGPYPDPQNVPAGTLSRRRRTYQGARRSPTTQQRPDPRGGRRSHRWDARPRARAALPNAVDLRTVAW